MKVSGFSICRNAVKFDYPVVEAIRSALPIVDEFVVNVGRSDDGTLDLIRSIGSDKIRIVETVWDDSMKKDGLLFSHETNKALARCSGDWALYLQADEVLHEQDTCLLLDTFIYESQRLFHLPERGEVRLPRRGGHSIGVADRGRIRGQRRPVGRRDAGSDPLYRIGQDSHRGNRVG